MTKLAVIFVPLMALSGCALSHPVDPYDGMPAFWKGQVGTTETPTSRGAVALVEPDGPLMLAEAVRIALANNPETAARGDEVRAAAAQKDFAKGEALPHFSLETDYSHYLDSQRLVAPSTNGQTGVFGRDIVSGGVVMRIPLYTGGRITSEIDAAELLTKAAQHQLVRSREELVFNVSSLYYNILAQRHVVESLRFSQRALERHLEQVEHQIEAQKAANVDRLRTQVRLANIDQQIVAAQNVLSVQREAMADLLGLAEGHAAIEIVGELEADPPAGIDPSLAVRRALAQREDFLAAQASLEAQARAVDAARAARWPSISGEASYGGRWGVDPTVQPAGTDRLEDVGMIGFTGHIPLFEGGQIVARIRRERMRLSAARQRLRALALRIQLDVKTALLNIESTYKRVQATKAAIEQATESLRIEREKYDLGKGSITDVLDAQSSLLFTQTSYYAALSDHNVALAQYRLAVGEPLQ